MKNREETLYGFKNPEKKKRVLLVKEKGIYTFLHIGKAEGKEFEMHIVFAVKKVTKKGITAYCHSVSEKPVELYLKWNEIVKL